MQFSCLAASYNADSLNLRLIQYVQRLLQQAGHRAECLPYAELESPTYRDDHFLERGLPAGAQRLADAIASSHGWVIAMPEYNWSIPGHLKNLIDWLSRGQPVAFAGKPCLLMSASPSLQGGVKGLLQLKQPLEALGAFTYPQLITVSDATHALAEDGSPTLDIVQQRVISQVTAFIDYSRKLNVV